MASTLNANKPARTEAVRPKPVLRFPATKNSPKPTRRNSTAAFGFISAKPGTIIFRNSASRHHPVKTSSDGMPAPAPARPAAAPDPKLRALYLEYALDAVGSVPHMVFLVDFIANVVPKLFS